jgi:peptide/nickel transport system permease protein
VAPHSPTDQDLALRLRPPAWLEGGTSAHLLGTDQLGRDNLSRIIFASRVSLSVALAVVAITLVIGTALGVAAGYFGGKLDHVIMAATDVLMAFPGLLLVMALAALMGPGLGTIIAALSVRFWTTYTRISRGMVLSLKETDFMMAAWVVGGTRAWNVRSHLVPNLISPLATLIPLELGRVMLSEAAVSFLGLGIQPPSASWGILVADGRGFISTAWWLITFSAWPCSSPS